MKTLLALLTLAVSPFGQNEPRVVGRVLFVDGSQSVEMKYSVSSVRGTLSMFATVKQYLVFEGSKATLRTKHRQPSMEFYASSDLDIPSAIYLLRFDAESDRRQIRVGKSRGKVATTGIPKDHSVDSTVEELGDGPNSTKRYRLKPSSPLRPGEYCLVRSTDTCFDFGVDP